MGPNPQACGGETLPKACYTFLPVGATSVPGKKVKMFYKFITCMNYDYILYIIIYNGIFVYIW